MTDIYIISGFLGAGKTTLIRKLLEEVFDQKKVVLIENDFGEISVDATLLREKKIEVKEMNAGCICCSLAGDFVEALLEVVSSYQADCILIEPSGVGKLSDIISVCRDSRLMGKVQIRRKITVVDAVRFEKYLCNYGEFFEDQIKNADTIIFSHMEEVRGKESNLVHKVRRMVRQARIFSGELNTLSVKQIISSDKAKHVQMQPVRRQCGCGCHGNCHHAEEVFDTVTLRTKECFLRKELERRVGNLIRQTRGEILRAKGIVKGENGYLNFQYLPGEMTITECEKPGDMICVIGHNLSPTELQVLFDMR